VSEHESQTVATAGTVFFDSAGTGFLACRPPHDHSKLAMDYITPASGTISAAVNRLVIERLHFRRGALVESIGQYIVEGGGKRMRPLSHWPCAPGGGALELPGTAAVELAAVMRVPAPRPRLLHDDVRRRSALRRRGAPPPRQTGQRAQRAGGRPSSIRAAFQVLVGIATWRSCA